MKRLVGRTFAVLALGAFGTAFMGCSRFSHNDAAADAGAPVVTVDAQAPTNTEVVANESAVKRYADEKPLDQIPTIIEAAFTDPRTEAGMGDVVVTIARSTSVRPVAQKGAFVLVQFSDPKDTTRMLEGWVMQTTLKPKATAPVGSVKPVTPVPSSTVPVPTPTAPTPTAPTAPTPTAPTPTAPTPTTPVAPGKLVPIKVLPNAGKCGNGYNFVGGKYCRLECSSDAVCGMTPGAKCTSGLCYAPGEKP